MCTQAQALNILGEVFDLYNVLLKNKVKDVYLYGSYARGDFHMHSDVDILITADMSAEDLCLYRNSAALLNSELSLKYDVTVSVTLKPLEQFLKYANILPYYKNVIREGIKYAI